MKLHNITTRRRHECFLSCCVYILVASMLVCQCCMGFLVPPSSVAPPRCHSLQRLGRTIKPLVSLTAAPTDENDDDEDEDEFDSFYDEDDDDNDTETDEEDEVDFEKFEIATGMNEDSDELSPLLELMRNDETTPETTSTSSSSTVTPPTKPEMDETQRRIEEQQQQIDLLMKLVQSQATTPQPDTPPQTKSEPFSSTPLPFQQDEQEEQEGTSPPPIASSSNIMAPLKAMMFIDGTWLYYSIHGRRERDCPIVRKFGRGWQFRYKLDWTALPRVVCEELQKQQTGGWGNQARPMEISRASVYTSMKSNTQKQSFRVRLYEDMKEANYDVFCMTTEGKGEKCVDIQLAVEMLHYATVPNAYDVAILLSGDKDFLPALVRTRQKGRQVAIVSMRAGCNRALYETPNVKDYNVLWMEDYLDQLFVPLPEQSIPSSTISRFTLSKILFDFVQKSDMAQVSSRDVGRYLKHLRIGPSSLLDQVKEAYGGLFHFLSQGECFDLEVRAPPGDRKDRSFWISVSLEAQRYLLEMAKRTVFSNDEKDFFNDYSLEELDHDETREKWYFHSENPNPHLPTPQKYRLPAELVRDYSQCTVVQLKDTCREFGLPVSGTKAVLLERIQSHVDAEKEASRQKPTLEKSSFPQDNHKQHVNPTVSQHLESLIREYLHASGGQASSRDVGRYLAAANGSSDQTKSALTQLKQEYGTLATFVTSRQDEFVLEAQHGNDNNKKKSFEFRIKLLQKQQ